MTEIRFDQAGLVPVVAQSIRDGAVLMVAYADQEAVAATLATGEAHYHSRSRGEVWHKGATSGNKQRVLEVRYDCDADALLYLVEEAGPACHTGERSCFFRVLGGGVGAERKDPPAGVEDALLDDGTGARAGTARLGDVLEELEAVVLGRLRDLPDGSYVRKLHERGIGYMAQKVVEEAGETVVAALQDGELGELVGESADLLFHLLVLLAESGVPLEAVAAKLEERRR